MSLKDKIVRRILSVLLPLTFVLVMILGISVAVHVNTNDYLTFTGTQDFTISTTKGCNGTLEYSTDGTTWTVWNRDDDSEISSKNKKLYLRGSGNNKITCDSGIDPEGWHITTNGTVACSGDIRMLLDYNNPDGTKMDDHCFSKMFEKCAVLTTAPELPATTLADCCYYSMFCDCSSIKILETKSDEYNIEYRIPSFGEGVRTDDILYHMFDGTGGTFKGTPDINKTYYLSASN